MRPLRRELIAPIAVALLGSAVVGWLGLLTMVFSDYESEAQPALQALRHGNVGDFIAQAPAYGGSLVLRAPFALLPALWGGGEYAVYRAVAIPCLAAGVFLAVFVWQRAVALGHGRTAAYLALALCAANPITLAALEYGHPEELLGAVLCIAAALAAAKNRPVLAGLLLGLAVANKAWAVVAVVPVLLMLPGTRPRAVAGAVAGAVAAVILAPLMFHAHAGVSAAASVARDSGTTLKPWEIWWFFGDNSVAVYNIFGVKPGYRAAPDWISHVSKPLVVLASVAIPLAVRSRLRDRAWHDGLLLLALVLFARCLLDSWNVVYYSLPFLLALTVWEVHARRGLPVVSLVATLLTYTSFQLIPRVAGPDMQSVTYLAWTLPLFAALAWRLYSPDGFRAAIAPLAAGARRNMPSVAALLDGRPAAGRAA